MVYHKRIKKIYYNRTNTCDICGKDLVPGKSYREYDKEGKWTGRWLCNECWGKYYQKNDADSQNNMKRSLAGRRTGNLNPSSTQAKGDVFEYITCKVRGVKNLNIENDNYNSPIDHSRDQEYGILQSKGSIYNPKYKRWDADLKNERLSSIMLIS